MNVTNFPKCSMTITPEQSPSVPWAFHSVFFSLPSWGGKWQRSFDGHLESIQCQSPHGSAPSYINVCMVCVSGFLVPPGYSLGNLTDTNICTVNFKVQLCLFRPRQPWVQHDYKVHIKLHFFVFCCGEKNGEEKHHLEQRDKPSPENEGQGHSHHHAIILQSC